MKVITLEEFMANPSPAIYANWQGVSDDGAIDMQLPELLIKVEQPYSRWWWGFAPWSTDMTNLIGAGTDDFPKLCEFMQNPTGSLKFNPSMTREDATISNEKVLVFEDADIDHLLGILIRAFPEHAKRVIAAQNQGDGQHTQHNDQTMGLLTPLDQLRTDVHNSQVSAANFQRNIYINASNIQKDVSVEPVMKFIHQFLATSQHCADVQKHCGEIKVLTNNKRLFDATDVYLKMYTLDNISVTLVEDLECRPTIFTQLNNYINFEGFAIEHPSVVGVYGLDL